MPRRTPARAGPRTEAEGLRDAFFRHMVANMRNGVLAITRGGEVVLMNDEACRIFALPPGGDLHRPPVHRRPPVASGHRQGPRRLL